MLNALRQLFSRETPEVGAAEPVTLESLLDRGWLELFYQPKIDLRTRRLVGAEGLIRARHPVRGILPPAAFLPGANEDALLAMTEYVIRTALRDWESFAARGTPLKLSVNTPVSALLTLPLTTMLQEERPRTANWPGLILEVTEDEIIHDLKLANEVAANLRSLNCTLAWTILAPAIHPLPGCASFRSASSRSTAAMPRTVMSTASMRACARRSSSSQAVSA
jgi:EAL domain-containing protein (putative c-di-GMP-specific phosphodiesterase class I)